MQQTDLYPVRVGDTLEPTDLKNGEPIFVTFVHARDGLFRIEVQAPPHIQAQGIEVIPRPRQGSSPTFPGPSSRPSALRCGSQGAPGETHP